MTTQKEYQEINGNRFLMQQGKCLSCGKYWDMFDCFDELLAICINKGKFQTKEEIDAVGIIREKFKEEFKK